MLFAVVLSSPTFVLLIYILSSVLLSSIVGIDEGPKTDVDVQNSPRSVFS